MLVRFACALWSNRGLTLQSVRRTRAGGTRTHTLRFLGRKVQVADNVKGCPTSARAKGMGCSRVRCEGRCWTSLEGGNRGAYRGGWVDAK